MTAGAPRVSVITVTYNHSAYIEACLESVLAQDHPSFEVIVVDDGSDDGTAALLERYAGRPGVQVLLEPHRGVAHLGISYNLALARASGELVAILEGDDLWPPGKLGAQATAMAASDAILTYGRAHRVDARGTATSTWHARSVPDDVDYDASVVLLDDNPIPAVTAMIRRAALERIGGFHQVGAMPPVDYPTWTKLALDGPFRQLPFVLGRWRHHGGSQSLVREIEVAAAALAASAELAERVGARLPPHWPRVLARTLLSYAAVATTRGAWRPAARSLDLFHSVGDAFPGAVRAGDRVRALVLRRLTTARIPLPRRVDAGRIEAWDRLDDVEHGAMLDRVGDVTERVLSATPRGGRKR